MEPDKPLPRIRFRDSLTLKQYEVALAQEAQTVAHLNQALVAAASTEKPKEPSQPAAMDEVSDKRQSGKA
jgi:hypothetical protein